MDKLWTLLPLLLCIGMHFLMMKGHGDHGEHKNYTGKNLGYDESMYTCPMHPEVKSDKPGSCPKCGMTLVSKK